MKCFIQVARHSFFVFNFARFLSNKAVLEAVFALINQLNRMNKSKVFLTIVCIAAFTITGMSQRLGVGAQFGDPTGLSLRINNAGKVNLDMLASWRYDRYFFFNIHGLWEQPVAQNVPNFHYFYGPGAFIYVYDRKSNRYYYEDEVGFGISGTIGLNVYLGQHFEIFGQLTPRLGLFRGTYGEIGGGVGARFYF